MTDELAVPHTTVLAYHDVYHALSGWRALRGIMHQHVMHHEIVCCTTTELLLVCAVRTASHNAYWVLLHFQHGVTAERRKSAQYRHHDLSRPLPHSLSIVLVGST